ncbi:uncharacterized protein N7482_002513 [Penicillium canariense]|uniref:BTB domain-containing protein n=1 Tax=Penicillium canariense TaxID=189055 RepID=A0A9W9ILX2_9EURO|nr:uncharacterized protein N7482_002513 [Penicillium canariense]KAJ5176636.1 hypothetical protein N7482_002513 [Penicillium canariense]
MTLFYPKAQYLIEARFLASDTVELCTATNSETLKIHQKLLASKCKAPMVALTHGFSERESGRYTFTDTSQDTVAQFIEWAYRGDYTEMMLAPIEVPQPKQLKDSAELPNPELTGNENKALQAHTLLCHLRLYIFSDVYFVSGLKELAFEKFTAALENMGKPRNLNEQLAVIDCLSLAFSRVPLHDKLIEWLAQYAAWCLDKLRLQSQFHDLLQRVPALSSRMMDTVNPANEAPWNTTASSRNYHVPAYDTRADFGYEDDY